MATIHFSSLGASQAPRHADRDGFVRYNLRQVEALEMIPDDVVREAAMIDRVVLHGAPGVDPGVPYIHLLDRPYEGDPPLTMTLPMRRLDGLVVTNIEVHYTYTGTDERGIPHYRTRAAGGAVLINH